MATDDPAKSVVTAAMSFKDTPAPNCRTGQHFIKNLCNSHHKRPTLNLKEYYEKIKEENADTKKED